MFVGSGISRFQNVRTDEDLCRGFAENLVEQVNAVSPQLVFIHGDELGQLAVDTLHSYVLYS